MGNLTGMVSTIALFAFLAAIILVPIYLRHQDRQRLQETLRIAIESGRPIPPEVISAMQTNNTLGRPMTRERDLRRAVIYIALGLGCCGFGYGLWFGLMSVNEIAADITGGACAGIGAIPGLVGVGHLILWASGRGAARG